MRIDMHDVDLDDDLTDWEAELPVRIPQRNKKASVYAPVPVTTSLNAGCVPTELPSNHSPSRMTMTRMRTMLLRLP